MIVAEHVTKYYGSHAAVRDLDFRIEEGECIGFLGLNGAGKTTTLRLLSCLLLPTSGRITVRGLDAEQSPHEIRKFIGFLPDRPPLYEEMTVRQFLTFAGKLRQMTSAAVDKRMPEVFDLCSLHEVADQDVSTLSHGYKQRVGIAQAIIHNPTLLILDEPIQGLDPVQIVEMRAMIRNLRGRHTILLSTHILSEIKQTCDRILMLSQGRIAAEGSEPALIKRFGGVSTIEVELRGNAAKVEALLSGIAGIQRHDLAEGADNTMTLSVHASRDVREDLSRELVQGGIALLGLRSVSTGLEGIFVDLNKASGSSDASVRSIGNNQ